MPGTAVPTMENVHEKVHKYTIQGAHPCTQTHTCTGFYQDLVESNKMNNVLLLTVFQRLTSENENDQTFLEEIFPDAQAPIPPSLGWFAHSPVRKKNPSLSSSPPTGL